MAETWRMIRSLRSRATRSSTSSSLISSCCAGGGVRALDKREVVLDQIAEALVGGIHRDRRIRSGRANRGRPPPLAVLLATGAACGGESTVSHQRDLYAQKCASCHGVSAAAQTPVAGAPNLLAGSYTAASRCAVR